MTGRDPVLIDEIRHDREQAAADAQWEMLRPYREAQAQADAIAAIEIESWWRDVAEEPAGGPVEALWGQMDSTLARCMAHLDQAMEQINRAIVDPATPRAHIDALTTALSQLQRIALDYAYKDALRRLER